MQAAVGAVKLAIGLDIVLILFRVKSVSPQELLTVKVAVYTKGQETVVYTWEIG